MPRPSPITKDQELDLVAKYVSGVSRNRLAIMFDASRPFVTDCLRRHGVAYRQHSESCTSQRLYSLRQDAFANCETEDVAAYWAGVLMSDGCVSRSLCVILTWKYSDVEHLKEFARFLGTDLPIAIVNRESGTDGRLAVTSRSMCRDLAKYGIVERKAHTAKVSGLEHSRHFWRGVIDGDGWVGEKIQHVRLWPHLTLSGAQSLVSQFACFAKKIATNSSGKVVRGHGQYNWQFALRGHYAVQVMKHLYRDGEVSMPRKKAESDRIVASWPLDLSAQLSKYEIRAAMRSCRTQTEHA